MVIKLEDIITLITLVKNNIFPSIIVLLMLFFTIILAYKKSLLLQKFYNYIPFMKKRYVVYSIFTKKEGNIKNVKDKYSEQGYLHIKSNFFNFFNEDGSVSKKDLQKVIKKQKKKMKKAIKYSKNYNSLVYVGFPHVPLAFLNGKHFQDTDEVNLYEYQGRDSECLEQGFYELKRRFNTKMNIFYELPKEKCDEEVALKIQQSFTISKEDIQKAAKVEQIFTLEINQPDRWKINNYAQVDLYQKYFVEMLDELKRRGVSKIHLFSTSPVSLSFSLGRVINHYHPEIIIYNYNNNSFDWGINLSNEKLIFLEK